MKNRNSNKLFIVLGLISLVIGLISACKKDNVDLNFVPTRQFTPATITVSGKETSALITWSKSLFSDTATTYTVEFAKDSLFTTGIELTKVTDSLTLTVQDEELAIKQKHYARIKANATAKSVESKFITSKSFTITGEQLFLPVYSSQVTETTVLLKWRVKPNISKVVLTPVAGGTAVTANIGTTERNAGQITVTGLQPNTNYEAELFAGNVSKGKVSFGTPGASVATQTLAPTDDLAAAIAAASNNAVIAIQPGTYDLTVVTTDIIGKNITLQSVSKNPNNTKINFKQFNLKGSGAGIKFSGIEFDGSIAPADYFINVVGLNSDGEAATFKSIVVENCKIHFTRNCLIRANRGSNNGQKLDDIKFDNCILYDNNASSYSYFMMDKSEFKTISITNTTIYNSARAIISWGTNITPAQTPVITIDHVTINGFGSGVRNNIVLDANTNTVTFTMQNSIIANTPKAGETVGTNAIKAAGNIKFNNNDYFNLNTGDGNQVTFGSNVTLISNKTVDLGWNASTTTFALPANSELRTAGTLSDAIGDPRWH
ncbi:DUF4957 domain-containing protein [Pedobacter sp. SD-b]|uniref:DUF4957 domain-containing protein n=1 Tax=Pedobacter segetis TaxID=2793069 RepID=A0ABS1BJP9_9SPHI|nr:DUF4957 domain-containing protein [Pedobacter segetis]MBK0383100.1 DUF4957 domain-containing protein [Pedobacter segetis]